jgi:hypothetical protein
MKLLIKSLIFAIAFSVLPWDLLKGDPAKLLMPFIGLFMAGIFPAISLTVNSLKSGGFSVKRINDLSDELSQLLDYLQILFVVSLTAAITLVTAEALDWGKDFYFKFYTARIFNFLIGFCFGILIMSLPKIRLSFTSLLDISKRIAVDEAATKVSDRAAKIPSIVDRFPTKEKFGELFEIPQDNERKS